MRPPETGVRLGKAVAFCRGRETKEIPAVASPALRLEVNREIDELTAALPQAIGIGCELSFKYQKDEGSSSSLGRKLEGRATFLRSDLGGLMLGGGYIRLRGA